MRQFKSAKVPAAFADTPIERILTRLNRYTNHEFEND